MRDRGFAGALLVLAGGLCPDAWLATMPMRMVVLGCALVGLGMIGSAWLGLCRDAADRRVDLAHVRFTTFAWMLPLLPAKPLFSNDGWSYAAQGAMTQLGLSPYIWTPNILDGPLREAVDPMWRNTPTPYGPLPLQWGDLVASFTQHPWVLVICYRVLALLGIVMLAWAIPRLAEWSGVNPVLASALALGSPMMVANGMAGLHNDVVMVGLMAVALVVGIERGWMYGAVLGGLAAAVKAPGGVVCLGIVVGTVAAGAGPGRRILRAAQVGIVSVGTLAVVGLPGGLHLGWIGALSVPGEVQTPLSLTTMLGRLVGEVAILRGLGLVIALAGLLWLSFRTPTGARAEALRATVLGSGFLLVFSPTVHLWYLLWVLPLAAALRLSRPQAFIYLAVGIVAGIAAPMDSSLHGVYVLIVTGTALALIVAAIVLLTRSHRSRMESVAGVDHRLPSDAPRNHRSGSAA